MATKTLAADAELHDIAIEAYQYLYPMVLMEATRRVMTNVPPGVRTGMGPMNAFWHFPEFPPAEFRDVVRPNFDTLYSSAWLDLRRGPVIVQAPDTAGRYYLLPMLDMWSDVIAVPGKRTSGTKAGAWAVVPPGWTGDLPAGVERIQATTAYLWIIGRTQTNGPADYPAVHAVQAGYTATPLAAWGKKPKAARFVPDKSVDMKTPPMFAVDAMDGAEFFALGAELMRLHPPHVTDWSQVARIARLGIVPGRRFDPAKASPAVRAALDRAPRDGMAVMKQKAPTLARVINGWQMNTDSIGVYGNYYLKRAIVALIGLGANQPEDAIYPLAVCDADGKPFDAASRYVMHFEKSELPPVSAFWSLTMYDGEGFPVANALRRQAIGDRDPLVYNADGSLDLYIQAKDPGGARTANWLPSPASGPMGPTMRLYGPKAPVLDGRWVPPAIRRAK